MSIDEKIARSNKRCEKRRGFSAQWKIDTDMSYLATGAA